MTEDFLHFIWKFKTDGIDFQTPEGETIRVVRPGEHNHDAGPDFLHARVSIAGTLWAGNVELHVRSSDWLRHGHEKDDAYDNIVLHVVFYHDQDIRRKNGEWIPTLALEGQLPAGIYDKYQHFLNNHLWIPCAMSLRTVNELVVKDWLTALSVIRLERKCKELESLLDFTGNDWSQAFYQSLAGTLGFRINRQPFELLARQTPVQFLEKHKDDILQAEAILFGQAGLLSGRFRGEYPKMLKREYTHLRYKFSLQPVPGHLWKFLRLRPNNFPTIRIAQLAMIIHQRINLFGEIIEKSQREDFRDLFQVGVSDYWKTHYYFDRPSKAMNKSISPATVDLILINNVVPFLFVYGKNKGLDHYCDRALRLLASIPAESNAITRKYATFGIAPRSADQSQALLELKANYCDQKRCLECRIGVELVAV